MKGDIIVIEAAPEQVARMAKLIEGLPADNPSHKPTIFIFRDCSMIIRRMDDGTHSVETVGEPVTNIDENFFLDVDNRMN